MGQRLRSLWICLGLLTLVLAVYAQTRHFEFTNYDDPDYVTQNPHVTSGLTSANLEWAFTSGYAANWHPLTWLSHMLDVQLFGLNAGRHHWTSVALHALSTILLLIALIQMTGAVWASALVAALFAVHPLRAESVAWVAERKDTLSTFFWMITLFGYARFAARPNTLRYSCVILCFALGLMSKSMLVTLPFVLLLLDIWPLQRIDRESVWPRLAEKAPMLAMSVASSVMTYLVQQRGGAMLSLDLVPWSMRLENAVVSYAAYLRMIVWPAGLAPMYPFPQVIYLWQPIAASVLVLAVSALVVVQFRSRPYLTVGWLWYLGTLVPVLGLVQVGNQARADRYTYIPSIGIFLMVAWGIRDLVKARPQLRQVVVIASIALLAICAGLSAIQVSYWRDSLTLFNHTIAVTENNYLAYDALGTLMLSQDRPADAIPYLSKALEYNPLVAQTHASLGMASDDIGRPSDALNHFKQALAIDVDSADAHAGIGLVLAEMGAADESLSHMQEALRLRPDYEPYYFKLGEVYGLLDRLPEAEQAFRDAIRLDPSDPRSQVNLGIALGRQDKIPEAIAAFRAAIRLKPDDPAAWFNLGNALAQQDHLQEAISAFTEALRLRADFADARQALAQAQELLYRE